MQTFRALRSVHHFTTLVPPMPKGRQTTIIAALITALIGAVATLAAVLWGPTTLRVENNSAPTAVGSEAKADDHSQRSSPNARYNSPDYNHSIVNSPGAKYGTTDSEFDGENGLKFQSLHGTAIYGTLPKNLPSEISGFYAVLVNRSNREIDHIRLIAYPEEKGEAAKFVELNLDAIYPRNMNLVKSRLPVGNPPPPDRIKVCVTFDATNRDPGRFLSVLVSASRANDTSTRESNGIAQASYTYQLVGPYDVFLSDVPHNCSRAGRVQQVDFSDSKVYWAAGTRSSK